MHLQLVLVSNVEFNKTVGIIFELKFALSLFSKKLSAHQLNSRARPKRHRIISISWT